ncbi:MAG: bifunctional 4-hydroxy-2-oxoglutarate aldolase/2-dehydro-3-deoxy-phosphogluconate aldolase [Actinobacteria bacterium]|nr:bifunctional 4-hydroxy-2-oxoglutarate aldolase/2-dehydro-3-deoxy-phosphogluconate aldolase [Actinomycetota bacterium]
MDDSILTGASEVLRQIRSRGVVPVVTLADPSDAEPLAKSLVRGGLSIIEITLRTSAGLEAIQRAARIDGLLVGAGTVTDADQAAAAIGAGAQFIVSPGLDPAVVRACLDKNILVIPGISTPTEMYAALSLGLNVVKLFPAELLGGTTMVKTLSALDREISFFPTGGITLELAPAYLQLPSVIAVGGSWIAPQPAIDNGDWRRIERLATEAIAISGALR